jgi:hypothetical protein
MTNTKLFIIVWRSAINGHVWQSERYAHDANSARASFKRDRARLAAKCAILYTKEHGGQRYANAGRFV